MAARNFLGRTLFSSSFQGKSRFYDFFSRQKSLFVLLAKGKNACQSEYVVGNSPAGFQRWQATQRGQPCGIGECGCVPEMALLIDRVGGGFPSGIPTSLVGTVC